MPRYVRRRPARRPKSTVSAIARGGRKSAIAKVATAVKRIQRKMRTQTDTINFQQAAASDIPGSTPVQFALSNYSTYQAIFGTTANDFQSNKMIHKSFAMQCRVSLNSVTPEDDTVSFSAFLVRLKDEMASSINFSNGTLNLQPGIHYAQLGTASIVDANPSTGMVMLNKKYFDIIKYKRFTLTNNSQPLGTSTAQTQDGTDIEWYWKVKPNVTVRNPAGNWALMNISPDPSDNYFYLLFHNNTLLDLESPFFSVNAVHTVLSVQG